MGSIESCPSTATRRESHARHHHDTTLLFISEIHKVDLDRDSGALVGGVDGVHTIILSDNVPVVEG